MEGKDKVEELWEGDGWVSKEGGELLEISRDEGRREAWQLEFGDRGGGELDRGGNCDEERVGPGGLAKVGGWLEIRGPRTNCSGAERLRRATNLLLV